MEKEGSISTFTNTANKQVLAYLGDKSAHSDVAERLILATRPLGDAKIFCPDPSGYRYIMAHTNNIIFAFACGMSLVAFRLDEGFKERALQSGAKAMDEAGREWISFELFRNDWPEPDLKFWALKAYVYARETNI